MKCIPKTLALIGLAILCASCADNARAVMLPLQYPDGAPVTTRNGDPVMAGYQTYGSPLHANATALYQQATPATCATCAHVGAVVSEPSTLRQATAFLGTATVGAGAVMTGIGVVDYGEAAEAGKLGSNINVSNNVSSRNAIAQTQWQGQVSNQAVRQNSESGD